MKNPNYPLEKTVNVLLRILTLFLGYLVYSKIVAFTSNGVPTVEWDVGGRVGYVFGLAIFMFIPWRLTYDWDLWDPSDGFETVTDWICSFFYSNPSFTKDKKGW